MTRKAAANKVHIAGRGSVVRQLRILASQFRVLRTGTLSEIRPDNMYPTVFKFVLIPIFTGIATKNSTWHFCMVKLSFTLRANLSLRNANIK